MTPACQVSDERHASSGLKIVMSPVTTSVNGNCGRRAGTPPASSRLRVAHQQRQRPEVAERQRAEHVERDAGVVRRPGR